MISYEDKCLPSFPRNFRRLLRFQPIYIKLEKLDMKLEVILCPSPCTQNHPIVL